MTTRTMRRSRVSSSSELTRQTTATGAFALLLAACLFASAAPAVAQDPAVARRNLRLPLPDFFTGTPNTYWSVPAMGANTPGGFGAGWGDFYVGLGGTSRARFQDENFSDADAAAAFGLGFGDPIRNIGFEVTVNSYSTFEHQFFTRSGIDFHVHRQFLGDFSAAVGWENAITSGEPDAGESFYFVVSKWTSLREDPNKPFSALLVTGGLGNGRFRSQQNVDDDVETVNVFGSVALRVLAPLSLVADWTGQDLTAVASVAPFRNVSLLLLGGFADITGNTGDEGGARFVASISYGLSLRG
ncbi:MAG: hypothetical protein OEU54_07720 [Gemmatimonadota bacterium]|nr:hypothetical protein [Gemmatimonadota bacterium]